MKKKTITLVVYMLVCISLVSVGFAAWIITGGDESVAEGNVKATTVHDESLVVVEGTEEWVGGKDSIIFGVPTLEENETQNGWLQFDDNEEDRANLEVIYQFTLELSDKSVQDSTVGKAVKKLPSDKIKIELAYTNSAIQNAVSAKYITQPELKVAVGDDNYQSVDKFEELLEKVSTQSVVVKVKMTANWGAAFGGENPYVYFNKQLPNETEETIPNDVKDSNVTWKAYAQTSLKGLYECLYDADDAGESYNHVGTFKINIQVGADLPQA